MAASQSQGRVGQVKLCSLTPSAKGNFCLGCRGVGTFLIVAWQGGGESGHRAIFLQREEQCGCLQAPGWDCPSTKDFFHWPSVDGPTKDIYGGGNEGNIFDIIIGKEIGFDVRRKSPPAPSKVQGMLCQSTPKKSQKSYTPIEI